MDEAMETKTNEAWDREADVERFSVPETETVVDDGRPKELKAGIPIKRIPSDDCLLYPKMMFKTGEDGVPIELKERGEGIAVHKGEWVDIVPMAAMFQYLSLGKGSDLAFDSVCEGLSKKIVRWNWTDIVGEPYPQPFRQPEVLRSLEDDELVYLLRLLQTDESEDQRKNG